MNYRDRVVVMIMMRVRVKAKSRHEPRKVFRAYREIFACCARYHSENEIDVLWSSNTIWETSNEDLIWDSEA